VNVITIRSVNSAVEKEPLIRPFGFKGNYVTELWQTVSLLEDENGTPHTGLCTQNVLWSDADVFMASDENRANRIMYSVTERALQMILQEKFSTPLELQQAILHDLYDYARRLTGRSDLRETFVLNALVGIDNAAWLLYAEQKNIRNFDELIPISMRNALSCRHRSVLSVPLVSYGVSLEEIEQMVAHGYILLKIKLGQPGSQQEMLEKDIQRLSEIHQAIGDRETDRIPSGKIPYYLDANGRYESKQTLMKFLDHAEKIGALDRIVILEEPFPEHADIDVSDLPVRVAADESAHTERDAKVRIEMGYSAIALKAVAKTLSMSLKIAQIAHQQRIPCFCADLTVNPILVEWNKNVAARLAPLSGLQCGILETNGHQNYKRWKTLESYHPFPGAEWAGAKNGTFLLDEDYYNMSGGIFRPSDHYLNLVT
jgi:L-alanine-DL-glutamate epimerase-like enolase superfamily enzyme